MSRTVVTFLLSLCLVAFGQSQDEDLYELKGTTPMLPSNSTEVSTNVRVKKNVCDCVCGTDARGQMNIVGGRNARAIHEFPWITNIQVRRRHRCQGVIITHKHVVTTASCVYGIKVPDFYVVAGLHTLNKPTKHEQYKKVRRIAFHKDFNPKTYLNDIAMLYVEDQYNWAGGVRPACLPFTEDMDYSQMPATMAGWGSSKPGELPTKHLRSVELPVLTNEWCKSRTPDHGDMVRPTSICTGQYRKKHGGPCTGDNGAPLHINYDAGVKDVIGILSWGCDKCNKDEYPAVYTRLSKYLKWIDKEIGDTCRCTRRA